VLTGLIWLRIGTVAGCCENGNEPSGFVKCWEIFLVCEQLVTSEGLTSMELVTTVITYRVVEFPDIRYSPCFYFEFVFWYALYTKPLLPLRSVPEA
jgi:hypothetical protein